MELLKSSILFSFRPHRMFDSSSYNINVSATRGGKRWSWLEWDNTELVRSAEG